MADGEGFELPEGRPSTVFKTYAIDHSAIHPRSIATTIHIKNKNQEKFFKKLQINTTQSIIGGLLSCGTEITLLCYRIKITIRTSVAF